MKKIKQLRHFDEFIGRTVKYVHTAELELNGALIEFKPEQDDLLEFAVLDHVLHPLSDWRGVVDITPALSRGHESYPGEYMDELDLIESWGVIDAKLITAARDAIRRYEQRSVSTPQPPTDVRADELHDTARYRCMVRLVRAADTPLEYIVSPAMHTNPAKVRLQASVESALESMVQKNRVKHTTGKSTTSRKSSIEPEMVEVNDVMVALRERYLPRMSGGFDSFADKTIVECRQLPGAYGRTFVLLESSSGRWCTVIEAYTEDSPDYDRTQRRSFADLIECSINVPKAISGIEALVRSSAAGKFSPDDRDVLNAVLNEHGYDSIAGFLRALSRTIGVVPDVGADEVKAHHATVIEHAVRTMRTILAEEYPSIETSVFDPYLATYRNELFEECTYDLF